MRFKTRAKRRDRGPLSNTKSDFSRAPPAAPGTNVKISRDPHRACSDPDENSRAHRRSASVRGGNNCASGSDSFDPCRGNGDRDTDGPTTGRMQPCIRGGTIAKCRETSSRGLDRLGTDRLQRCSRPVRMRTTVGHDCTWPGQTPTRPCARVLFTFLERAWAGAPEYLGFCLPLSRPAFLTR